MNAEQQTLGNPLTRLGRAILHWFDTSKSQTFDAQARHDGPDTMYRLTVRQLAGTTPS